MKKLSLIILGFALTFALIACGGIGEVETLPPESTESKSANPNENEDVSLWEVYENSTPYLAEGEKEIFDKAQANLVGLAYEPIAVIGQQVVAGMNYAYLCKGTALIPGAVPELYIVFVYNDLSGNATITEQINFDISKMANSEAYPEGLAGGWNQPLYVGVDNCIDSESLSVFDYANSSAEGRIDPLSTLAKYTVGGGGYAYLALVTAEGAENPVLSVVFVVANDESYEVSEIKTLNALDYKTN